MLVLNVQVGMTYDRTLPIPWRRSVSLDMLKAGCEPVLNLIKRGFA